jgi:hypothetical protein
VAACSGAVNSVTEANNTACLEAMNEFWDSLGGVSDSLFVQLIAACESLASACEAYAGAIDKARHDLKVALAEIGVAVALTTVAGILLTVFTGGGSDAAAGAADAAEVAAIAEPVIEGFEAEVAAEVDSAIAADVAAALDSVAAEAPTVEAVEAETTEVDSAVEQELADAEGLPEPPEEPVPTVDQGAADVLEPDGDPIGEQGDRANVRVMDEANLDRTWSELVDRYGPAREIQTPKGKIEYVETPDGGRIQLRDYSKSGGKTIDIKVNGIGIRRIHLK